MRSVIRTIETDVCVVGAGLSGLAHAHEARRRGLSVVVLERDVRAVGGSVRHTGHLFLSGLASGQFLNSAAAARERWLELGRRSGMLVETAGTLIVARRRDELDVMEAAAAEEARGGRMLTPEQVAALAPLPMDGVVGGFHGTLDLRIDPRAAAAALSRLLARDRHARVEWAAPVHDVEPGVVHAGPLRVRAEAIVVCAGADQTALPEALRPQPGALRLCQLQLLRLGAPTGRRYRPALTTALGMLDAPGFAAQEGAAGLRARIELERPELVERGARLVIAQMPGGDLLVGETSADTEAGSPFVVERAYRLLLEQARDLLGIEPTVRQRWQTLQLRPGRATAPCGSSPPNFLVAAPMPGVRVVNALDPQAVALGHTHAGTVLDALYRGDDPLEYADVQRIVLTDARDTGLRAHAQAFRTRSAARA